MSDEESTGSITPSGRFARIEAALNRIESKLDLKADTERVALLEGKFDALDKNFSDVLSGIKLTPASAEYLRRFTIVEQDIDTLKERDSNREAVQRAIRENSDSRLRSMQLFVAFATIVNLLIGTGAIVISVLS